MFGLAAYYSIDAYSQLCAHCAAFVKNISVLRKEKGHVEMDDSYVAKRSALFPLYLLHLVAQNQSSCVTKASTIPALNMHKDFCPSEKDKIMTTVSTPYNKQ